MASVYHLFDDAIHVQDYIVIKYKDHAVSDKRIYFAATKIQKVFRGYLVRKEMKKLHSAATMIQKHVRGWLLRYHLPDILHEYYDLKCMKYYNEMATRIQALWKGYQVRMYEVCIKDILREKAEMLRANEEMRKKMSQHRKDLMGGASVENNKMCLDKILTALFDRHHLLRTHQRSGVLSNHEKDELSELEKYLDCIPWTGYMKKLRELYNVCANQEEDYQYVFDDKKLRREEDLLRLKEYPVVPKRSFIDKNIHEKPFNFTTKIERKPYSRLIINEDKYTVVKKELLRSFDASKNICDKDFDLITLKKVANDHDVPPYYIDFWFQNCDVHNF